MCIIGIGTIISESVSIQRNSGYTFPFQENKPISLTVKTSKWSDAGVIKCPVHLVKGALLNDYIYSRILMSEEVYWDVIIKICF